jgi:hypothetical protein
MKNDTLLADFKEHLIAAGKSKKTIDDSARTVRRFLKHVGDQPLNRISEQATRSFFDGFKGQTRRQYAMQISEFLNFSQSRLPVIVNARGDSTPEPRRLTKKSLRSVTSGPSISCSTKKKPMMI